MSEIELAKCPFCDAELKRWDYMPNVFFEHPYNGCILSGKKVVENEHDVKAWNTRKPMERILTRLEEERQKWADVYNLDFDKGHINEYADVLGEGIDKAIEIAKEEGGIE